MIYIILLTDEQVLWQTGGISSESSVFPKIKKNLHGQKYIL